MHWWSDHTLPAHGPCKHCYWQGWSQAFVLFYLDAFGFTYLSWILIFSGTVTDHLRTQIPFHLAVFTPRRNPRKLFVSGSQIPWWSCLNCCSWAGQMWFLIFQKRHHDKVIKMIKQSLMGVWEQAFAPNLASLFSGMLKLVAFCFVQADDYICISVHIDHCFLWHWLLLHMKYSSLLE